MLYDVIYPSSMLRPEILQGTYRTRDQRGEPLATTYHSRFLGTVDYIW